MQKISLLIYVLLCFSCWKDKQHAILFPKGGYAYKEVKAGEGNFYLYPLKEIISKKDSVRAAFYDPQFYTAFDEPNLSLHTPKKPIVRLTYESGFLDYAAVLTLTEGQIVVKEKTAGITYADQDETKLDSLERFRLHLLERHYPISAYNGNAIRKKYYDSLTKAFPQLNNPRYYLALLHKAKVQPMEPFTYRTWRVTLSQEAYQSLMNAINRSEYWQLPFRDDRCIGESTDADGYSLEVATPAQYQMVVSTPCIKPTEFERACQRLMEVSGLQTSFNKYCNDAIQKARALNQ